MDLDSVQARIRPRRPWEAVDLGIAMVSVWRGPVYRAWLAAALPVVILVAALGYHHPLIAALLLWWLKPLLDRVPLHVLSRALFGDIAGWRTLVREVPGLWRRGFLRAILGHRFDAARSFSMPVDQLEGLRGAQRSDRLRVLGRRQWEEAMRLTIISVMMEMALTLGLILLAAFLLPERYVLGRMESLFEEGFEPGFSVILYLMLTFQALSILLLEPLYVAGGFCLYLNRRTQLEAWDLEMTFRRIARRRRFGGAPVPKIASIAMVLLLSAVCAGWSTPVVAVEPPESTCTQELPARQSVPLAQPEIPQGDPVEAAIPDVICLRPGCLDAHRGIADVLSDPVFGSTKDLTRWRFRQRPDRPAEAPWLGGLGALLGSALEPVLWTAAILCIVAFIVMRQRTGESGSLLDLAAASTGGEVLGLDLRGSSLPSDIPAEASRLLTIGRASAAVSLLFRGALADLTTRHGLRLHKGMTEGECVALARRSTESGRAALLAALAASWTADAYGHRPPEPGRLEALIAQWPAHFRSPS